jgi:hypothetical protein
MPLHLTNDVCRQIQCFGYTGEVSVQDMEDCRSRGFWPPLTCDDERCRPYPQCSRGSEMFLEPNPATGLMMPSLPQIVEDVPLPPSALQSVLPSITPPDGPEPGPLCPSTGAQYVYTDPLCRLGAWVDHNRVMAVALVLGVYWLSRRS